MDNYCIDQSEADTILFTIYGVLRELGYTGTVMTDASDTNIYVTAVFISHEFPGSLCIKWRQEIVNCRSLVSDQVRNCVIQLHCMTGCDANSGFFRKGKLSFFEQVAKSPRAR